MRPSLFAIILILLLFCPETAFGAISDDNLLDGIILKYKQHSQYWTPVIRHYAIRLFWLLAGLEMSWTGIRLALSQSDLGEVLAELTRRVLFVGFGYTLLIYSDNWAELIVSSLRSMADQASLAGGGSTGISPSTIFEIGYKVAYKIGMMATLWDPIDSIGLAISELVIFICFALIAALLLLALVEVYIVINAGIIVMAFGGSTFTSNISQKYFFYAFSVGIKLFVMQLLVGLGEAMLQGWIQDFEANDLQVLLMVGTSIVMLALVCQIPNILSGLISGSNFATGDHLVKRGASMAGSMIGVAAGGLIGTAPGALRFLASYAIPRSSGTASSFSSGFSQQSTSQVPSRSNAIGSGVASHFFKPPPTSPQLLGTTLLLGPSGGNRSQANTHSFMEGGKK